MNIPTAILIDDEESARDVLENLITRFCPEIKLLKKCSSLTDGVESIKELNPGIVFLDIEMPNYAGYEVVNFFEEITFQIIFVTAYDKYAIKAFEVSAIDYLLKPVDIDRLKLAVNKAIEQTNLQQLSEKINLLSNTLETNEIKSIAVLEKGYQYIVELKNIVALEAQESYCQIYTTEKSYMVSKNLKYYETLFQELGFFVRTHKSWIVNTNFISHYSKTDLSIHLTSGIIAKLSKYKKQEFEELLIKS